MCVRGARCMGNQSRPRGASLSRLPAVTCGQVGPRRPIYGGPNQTPGGVAIPSARGCVSTYGYFPFNLSSLTCFLRSSFILLFWYVGDTAEMRLRSCKKASKGKHQAEGMNR